MATIGGDRVSKVNTGQQALHSVKPTCFDVFRRAAMWVMTFALETGRGRHVELGGFELSLAEMEAIQLPIRDILVAMGGGRPPANAPPLDLKYWRTIIHQFSICGDDNHIQHLFPGNPIPEYAKIHTVEFAKGVGNVPFEYIVSCIEQTGTTSSRTAPKTSTAKSRQR